MSYIANCWLRTWVIRVPWPSSSFSCACRVAHLLPMVCRPYRTSHRPLRGKREMWHGNLSVWRY